MVKFIQGPPLPSFGHPLGRRLVLWKKDPGGPAEIGHRQPLMQEFEALRVRGDLPCGPGTLHLVGRAMSRAGLEQDIPRALLSGSKGSPAFLVGAWERGKGGGWTVRGAWLAHISVKI